MEDVLQELEQFCKTNNIDHRFVGGVAYAGWLTPQTKFVIDYQKRQVTLIQPRTLEVTRSDGTLRDIDMIVLNPKPDSLTKLNKFCTSKFYFPPVSIEPVTTPHTPKSKLPQFVTALMYDGKNYFFSFDDIKQQIPKITLQPWHIQLPSGIKITVRHPYADYLAYHFRTPSGLKPKDRHKVGLLKNLSDMVTDKASYQTWENYIKALTSASGKIAFKAKLTKLYWHTVGPALAHSRLVAFANKFTGYV